MTPDTVGPFSLLVPVDRLPPGGVDVVVTASEEERAALAADFKLPGLARLEGRYRLSGTPERVKAKGVVVAEITQICVVTLETFDSTLEEQVEVDFAAPEAMPEARSGDEGGYEPPDEIVQGHVDLGSLTAEFLALGLDPYPKKPGASFAFEGGGGGTDSPFAGLDKLKRRE